MGKRQRRRVREQSVNKQRDPRELQCSSGLVKTDRLSRLSRQRRELDAAICEEIGRVRTGGVGWPPIAAALGVSRQAARQRYSGRGNKDK